MAPLTVTNLSKRFGGVVAVADWSLTVQPGTIVGLIGPNGSGKSTVFNLITNLLPRDAGQVRLNGAPIDGLKLHQIVRRGLGRTFQDVKIFRDLPVWRNMAVAALGRNLRDWEAAATGWLDALGLLHLASDPASFLSIGQQRLLELAMNLLGNPRLLLLDEPLAGVNPLVRSQIDRIIRERRDAGGSFIIIEHDMRFVMRLCDRLVVMHQGCTIADGTPADIRRDPNVARALLGHVA